MGQRRIFPPQDSSPGLSGFGSLGPPGPGACGVVCPDRRPPVGTCPASARPAVDPANPADGMQHNFHKSGGMAGWAVELIRMRIKMISQTRPVLLTENSCQNSKAPATGLFPTKIGQASLGNAQMCNDAWMKQNPTLTMCQHDCSLCLIDAAGL